MMREQADTAERGGAARRGMALAGLMLLMLGVPGGMVRAQMPEGAGDAATSAVELPAARAPVIAAPDDPGRLSPNALIPMDTSADDSGGYNAFSAGDAGGVPSIDTMAPLTMPVVVELFTAQGCSSCPPADAMLAALAVQPDVLPLSWHVDYWDYLGWADSFAKPAFSTRQEAYAHAAGERSVYTPQLIVEGVDTALSPGPAELMGLIDLHRLAPALVTLQRHATPDGQQIEVMALSDLGGAAAVDLIRYVPVRKVTVASGENRGKVVEYHNVVLDVQRRSVWDGRQPLRLTVRAGDGPQDRDPGDAANRMSLTETRAAPVFPADTRNAIIVQMLTQGARPLPGPIIAAMRLED